MEVRTRMPKRHKKTIFLIPSFLVVLVIGEFSFSLNERTYGIDAALLVVETVVRLLGGPF